MYEMYILRSLKNGRFYIGSAESAKDRLNKRHNLGKVKSTKGYLPWEIVYIEKFSTRAEAYKRERQIKSYKGGRAFKELIGENENKDCQAEGEMPPKAA